MKVRAKHRQFNFPYLYDGETQRTSPPYGPVATPHAFVFDKDRKLRYAGRIDDSERPQYAKTHELRDAIDAVLAGREPAVTTDQSLRLLDQVGRQGGGGQEVHGEAGDGAGDGRAGGRRRAWRGQAAKEGDRTSCGW